MIFLHLFYTFLLIGAFTFGGGYSMIALIQNEVVVNHQWMTASEFTDLLAVSQMTPAPSASTPPPMPATPQSSTPATPHGPQSLEAS